MSEIIDDQNTHYGNLLGIIVLVMLLRYANLFFIGQIILIVLTLYYITILILAVRGFLISKNNPSSEIDNINVKIVIKKCIIGLLVFVITYFYN